MGQVKGSFPKTVEYGLCHCGCGEKTTIARKNCTRDQMVRGEPMRYLYGHGTKSGCSNINWKGGKYIQKRNGTHYVKIQALNHPRVDDGGYVFEHIIIAEKALGKYLPKGAVVHHIDGNGLNNENSNLAICQD